MTQVPSSGHTEDCPRYEDQEMFTPCMIGQLEAHFLKMMVQLTDAKKTGEVGLFHLNDLNDAAFEPGLTSNRASSLRGRRPKGKGKGVRPRAFSLASPKALLNPG